MKYTNWGLGYYFGSKFNSLDLAVKSNFKGLGRGGRRPPLLWGALFLKQ